MPCAHRSIELCHGPGLTGEQNARHLSTAQFFASCVMRHASCVMRHASCLGDGEQNKVGRYDP
jgi:hypothetical protein